MSDLERLRWGPDRCVTTPFGERWWLKQVAANERGEGIPAHITECCLEEAPCARHAGRAVLSEGEERDG